MDVVGNSSKILFYLNDPVLSFDTNGIVAYRNSKAENLSQLTEIRIKEELIVPIYEFIDFKRNELKEASAIRKVEILDDAFDGDFFELNIRFDNEEDQFVCYFRNITEKVELENQIHNSEKLIGDHIEELTSANDVLKRQNEIIQTAQEETRSGLRYGKIIQDKINASLEDVKKLFPKSFTIYKPQGVIGGDLIWARKCKFGKVIAVVDCMGHGVPGAMLSMSVYHILNSTLIENKFESATELLCKVTEAYYKSFFAQGNKGDFRDTFDISLCVIDEGSSIVRYRGIKRPLLIVRDDELMEFKGDRTSVSVKEASQIIKKEPWDKVWPYKKGDMLYLFSDGFADQFGGPKNKKYKYSHFKKLIKQSSSLALNQQGSFLTKELWDWQNTFRDSFAQTDDVTVVGLEL